MVGEFHFLRPWWLLAIIPLAYLLFTGLWRTKGRNIWTGLVDKHLLPYLTVSPGEPNSRLPSILVALGWLGVVLILSGPVWERIPAPRFRPDIPPLVIVLDLSRSMDAIDLKPSRLGVAKAKIRGFLERLPPRQTGLVVYAGQAHTAVPLTEDTRIIVEILGAMETGLVPARGSVAAAGLRQALNLIHRAGEKSGEVLLVTDGVDDAAVGEARKLAGQEVRVSVLALGTATGGIIPMAEGGFLEFGGERVRPEMDVAPLLSLARAGKGGFIPFTRTDDDLLQLLSMSAKLGLEDSGKGHTEVWRERGPYLLLLLLPLALFGFRRGWLGAALLTTGIHAPQVEALGWEELWRNADQRGLYSLRQGDFTGAGELFRDPMWRGITSYRAGDYNAAAQIFALLNTPAAHYNRGNALIQQGKLQAGFAAYERALQLDPGHGDAMFNRKLVRGILEGAGEGQPRLPEAGSKGAKDQNGKPKNPGQVEDLLETPEPEKLLRSGANPSPQVEEMGTLGGGAMILEGTEMAEEPEGGSVGQSDAGGPDGRDSTSRNLARKGHVADGSSTPPAVNTVAAPEPESSTPSPSPMAEVEFGSGDGQTSAGGESRLEGREDDDNNNSLESGEDDGIADDGTSSGSSMAQERRGGLGSAAPEVLDREHRQALEQWLQRIPDNPAGLLRRKFQREYRRNPPVTARGVPW